MKPAPALAGLLAAAVVLVVGRQPAPPTIAPAPAASEGRAVFARMGCGSCHRLAAAGAEGPVGPDLDARLPSHTRASLVAVISDPPARSAMPRDFGRRMTRAELSALVEYLLESRR